MVSQIITMWSTAVRITQPHRIQFFLKNSKIKLGIQIFDLHFWSEIKAKNLRKNHPVNNIWNFSEMIKYWKARFAYGSIKFRLLNFSNVLSWPSLKSFRFVVTCNSVTFVTIFMRHEIVLFCHVLTLSSVWKETDFLKLADFMPKSNQNLNAVHSQSGNVNGIS